MRNEAFEFFGQLEYILLQVIITLISYINFQSVILYSATLVIPALSSQFFILLSLFVYLLTWLSIRDIPLFCPWLTEASHNYYANPKSTGSWKEHFEVLCSWFNVFSIHFCYWKLFICELHRFGIFVGILSRLLVYFLIWLIWPFLRVIVRYFIIIRRLDRLWLLDLALLHCLATVMFDVVLNHWTRLV